MIVSGFPRTGQTFFCHALHLMYNVNLQSAKHTVKGVERNILLNKKSIITFRHPIDSIASWHQMNKSKDLLQDIKFWNRYYSFVINNMDNLILANFNRFTKSLSYIENIIYANFNELPKCKVDDKMIKNHILTFSSEKYHLPSKTRERELDKIRKLLAETPETNDLVSLYKKMLIIDENQIF